MEEIQNKYIAVSYKLYTTNNGEAGLVEHATEDKPFQFVSGFGMTLPDFEKEIVNLNKGDEFDFTLTKKQAYGDFVEERVLDLDKSIFMINGHFDHENIYQDAYVELQNEDGNHFMGHVLEISEDKVKMDLNHPLAGKDLNFKGKVIESRPATNEEIEGIINRMHGGCNCDSCQGGCDGHHEHGEGHHHEGGCGCGHCH